MEDLQRRLGALLQAGAKKNLKLSVTPCILAELASLGAEFQGGTPRVAVPCLHNCLSPICKLKSAILITYQVEHIEHFCDRNA